MDLANKNSDEEAPLLSSSSTSEMSIHDKMATSHVYPLIWTIRRDIIRIIETPFSWEQLQSPHITYNVVQILALKYGSLYHQNLAIVYCLLVNRVHFISESSSPTHMGVNATRANLCELLALKVLRVYADKASSKIDLAYVLAGPFRLFQGASEDVVQKVIEEEGEGPLYKASNALEIAIVGNAKRFIKSAHCQKVINSIWNGSVVYTPVNKHAFISDYYKVKPITFFNPRQSPLLDHYRLKVPRIRSVIEYVNFCILFALFVFAIESNEQHSFNIIEIGFIFYALGFTLEKLASTQEHGWKVYSANLWNGFDLLFIIDFLHYLAFRVYGIWYDHPKYSLLGLEVLSCAAALLFPRLAFVTLSNNLMILSIRALFLDFLFLMALAFFCFTGFLYALWTLGRGAYTWEELAKYMLFIWFGLDGTGFTIAPNLHPVFGPVLIVLYACISNTLLLTVLVSILSTTFAKIDADAEAEYMFRQAVQTIEGVKSDALFGYQPPLNIFAWLVMAPARWILSPRWFHKFNVFMVRATAAPILLIISLYERYEPETLRSVLPFYKRIQAMADKIGESLPRKLKNLTLLEGLVGSGKDVAAAFEYHPDQGWDEDEEEDLDFVGKTQFNHDEVQRATTVAREQHYGTEENELHRRMCEEIEQRRLSQIPSRNVLSPQRIQQQRLRDELEVLQPGFSKSVGKEPELPFPQTRMESDDNEDAVSPLLSQTDPPPGVSNRRKTEGSTVLRPTTQDTDNARLQRIQKGRPRRMSNVEHTLSRNIGSLNSPLAKAFSTRPMLSAYRKPRSHESNIGSILANPIQQEGALQPSRKTKSDNTSPHPSQNVLQDSTQSEQMHEKLSTIDARQARMESILERLAKSIE
ncbi:hypothetical protein E3P92_01765 [Wallemia ichthyophaga]|uniref:Calcium channel YVC1 n=2 Tax=Wallemia ichthyophaga TaxID=245174 RepID=A0A4T0I9P5_WALIC|nr:Calcium channel YVC1 [Wallemia ichthyophaga EXF-994]TIA83241.1 hypothetical protein E3P98_00855 [Wallemia ichthyophaga]EOR01157.1 Calcium channel YVC1 [Wallemia ichthyophaga EXF-994]TIA99569.1 hypothetical protein E3P95_02024 [Wallemia ichthyophaga]TIB00561.1 hypothetical protein E3P94_02148 [Wallemia ichthyophaga]TIB14328.1 hypothetical protein E3P90_01311 [Wallemia ichthyophaga]